MRSCVFINTTPEANRTAPSPCHLHVTRCHSRAMARHGRAAKQRRCERQRGNYRVMAYSAERGVARRVRVVLALVRNSFAHLASLRRRPPLLLCVSHHHAHLGPTVARVVANSTALGGVRSCVRPFLSWDPTRRWACFRFAFHFFFFAFPRRKMARCWLLAACSSSGTGVMSATRKLAERPTGCCLWVFGLDWAHRGWV